MADLEVLTQQPFIMVTMILILDGDTELFMSIIDMIARIPDLQDIDRLQLTDRHREWDVHRVADLRA